MKGTFPVALVLCHDHFCGSARRVWATNRVLTMEMTTVNESTPAANEGQLAYKCTK